MSSDDSACPPPDPALCQALAKDMRQFALGKLEASRTRLLRSHLSQCPECMDQYRATVENAAVLGRTGQAAREERAIERQKHNRHVEHFGPRAAPKPSGLQYRLRLLLMPAFVILLLTQLARLGEPPVRVELVATSGVVKVDDVQRTILEDPYLVLPGRWITTLQFAKANLDGGRCEVELGAQTSCLLESARPVRMRLERGRIDVEGDLIVVSVLGLVTISEGQGRVVLDARGLHLKALSGRWTLLDKHGEHEVSIGHPMTIPPPAGIVSIDSLESR